MLDYFDLLYALNSFPEISDISDEKEAIIEKLVNDSDTLYEYFIRDDYGTAALAMMKKLNHDKLQVPKYIVETAKENLIRNLTMNRDYAAVDMAIYNYSKSYRYLDFYAEQIEVAETSIVCHQNENGSWGGEYGFFTPFALRALIGGANNSKDILKSIERGLEYAVSDDKYLESINSSAMMQVLFYDIEKGIQ